VLTETTARRTPALRNALVHAGWSHVEATSPPDREYGALVASRTAMRRVLANGGPAAHRATLVEFERQPLVVVGGYMPLPASGGPSSTLQVDFWRWLTEKLEARKNEALVFAGDLNTCVAIDGAGRDLPCADRLLDLQERGWRSAFRAMHPDMRAHSWWHHTGSGFRIDDAYVSPGFRGALRRAAYETSVGEQVLAWNRHGTKPPSTLSDHAAFLLDFDP
jgi:exonuclease III